MSGLAALIPDFPLSPGRQAAHLGPSGAERLGPVAVDLVSGWPAEGVEATAELPPAARWRALVENVRAFVRHDLRDPALTPALTAEAQHISVSPLHRIFGEENDGESVAAWIRRRLEQAHREFADPAPRGTPVDVPATRCGLPRPDDFSRAFRTAYGPSPHDHRRPAPGGDRPWARRIGSRLPGRGGPGANRAWTHRQRPAAPTGHRGPRGGSPHALSVDVPTPPGTFPGDRRACPVPPVSRPARPVRRGRRRCRGGRPRSTPPSRPAPTPTPRSPGPVRPRRGRGPVRRAGDGMWRPRRVDGCSDRHREHQWCRPQREQVGGLAQPVGLVDGQ
ncbi:hypothetical protein KSE_63485 [Kitasatospora setae KM-6054]|uniref:HTH araC/xylS-type domain-containing protein n=1 Tax=Kitasatospora setae (strain ATCC 33774 / DSM 43861 / JCM 3304 / KCC A-0304 / NBRC 14216 / KM-6054) TaxID=452652 RepID=E4N1S3_KITSK|nr:hypothetical protein KSE_63485 [Kitasatospora setae KM-6054]